MAQVNITRSGNLIQVYPDYHLLLAPHLQYQRRVQTGGDAASADFVRVYLYRMEDGTLIAPAGLLTRVCKVLRENGIEINHVDTRPRILPEPEYDRIDKLRPGQADMLAAAFSHDIGVIKGPTGAGKSFLIRQLCKAWPKANIIICSPFKRVVQRTYQELLEVLGPNEVGLIGAGGHTRARVTVATAQSLGHCDLEKVRLFIFDEVHKAAAPKTSALLSEVRLARMLGFSASPKGRSDGADLETEALFGPVIFDASYKDAQAAGSVVPVEVYVVDCGGLDAVNETVTSALNRHGIWRHRGRNRKLASAVAWARERFGQDIQILVTVSTVDHCVHLGALLPDFNICYGSMDTDERDKFARWGLIDPNAHPLTSKDRERMEEDFEKGTLKRCVATATSGGVWSTGVDFPHLRVLIRADGQGSPILNTQIPGRISRISEGKKLGVVIDMNDSHHPTLARRAERRFTSYRSKGWTIHQLRLP